MTKEMAQEIINYVIANPKQSKYSQQQIKQAIQILGSHWATNNG